MCDLCKRRLCAPNCPNCLPQATIRCASCGEELSVGDGFYRKNGFPYCESCLDFADTETLIRICETNKREWLRQMGFTHETAESRTYCGRLYDPVSN